MNYNGIFLALCMIILPLNAFDISRFFQATYYPERPRFAKQDLSNIAVRGGLGSTCKSFLCTEKSHPFLCPEYQINTLVFDGGHTFYHGFFVNATIPLYWFNFSLTDFTTVKHSHTVANTCLTCGWSINNEDFENLDFLDLTIETGCITPGNKPYFPDWALPLRCVSALGLYDWLTFGISVDLVEFFGKQERLWDIAWYLEADHIAHGFSFGFGYTHSSQKMAKIPWKCAFIPQWKMDTFHFCISYDAACEEYPNLPYIEFFYNHVLNGENIIPTPLWGLMIKVFF